MGCSDEGQEKQIQRVGATSDPTESGARVLLRVRELQCRRNGCRSEKCPARDEAGIWFGRTTFCLQHHEIRQRDCFVRSAGLYTRETTRREAVTREVQVASCFKLFRPRRRHAEVVDGL